MTLDDHTALDKLKNAYLRILQRIKASAPDYAFRAALASTLRQLRESRGLSQHKLAKLSGVSQAQISLIERGKLFPSPTVAKGLVHALDCEICLVPAVRGDNDLEPK